MGWALQIVKLLPLVITAVQSVEKLAGGKRGKEKQDAAVDMVGSLLPVIEGGIGRDLLDDAAVQVALRQTIDAVVALQNVVTTIKALHDATP